MPAERAMKYFYELVKIPHPSGNLTAMQDYLASFAEMQRLVFEKDTAGNVRILHRPVSSAENRTQTPHIILQAHLDMVPAVRSGSSFVFGRDSVEPYVKDGWIYAKETTLGADDGAGIAVCLAALSSQDLADCSFDCVFTSDEETTMYGAAHLSPSWLVADCLLNLDSESLSSVCVSSAGGADIEAVFVPNTEKFSGTPVYRLRVFGLLSGHSGSQIDVGRLNAILLGAAFLSTLHEVRLISCSGGSAKNSIPGTAEFVFAASDADVSGLAVAFSQEHAVETDPGLKMEVVSVAPLDAGFGTAWTKESSMQFLSVLASLPNGCFERNSLGPRVSSNLGVLSMRDDGAVSLICFARGNEDGMRDVCAARICHFLEVRGFQTQITGVFPGWSEPDTSYLTGVVERLYFAMFGTKIAVVSTHGGLEGGYFSAKNPHLRIASIGPDIENPHTIDERMHVGSFAKFTEFVFALVKRLCGVGCA